MTKISQILPAVSGDSTLPQLDYAALISAGYAIPEFEDDAAEDYLFDAAASTVLRSRVSGTSLIPVGSAPTYAANYLTVAAAINGLLCATSDQTAITFAAVFQRPASGPTSALAIIGSDAGPGGNVGAGLHLTNSGGYALSVRPGTGDPAISGAVGSAAVPANAWAFVAGSLSGTAATLLLGSPTPVVATGTLSSRSLGSTLGVGKVRDMGSIYDDAALSVHRAIVYKRALSVAEMTALYKRCQVVAGRRGITVV